MHNTTTTPANCAPMTPTGSPPKEIYLFWALQDAHNGPWFFLAWICVLYAVLLFLTYLFLTSLRRTNAYIDWQYAARRVVPMPIAMAPASASVVVPPSLPVFRPSLPSTKSPKSPRGENRSSPDEDKGLSGSEGGSPIVIGGRKEPVEPLPPRTNSSGSLLILPEPLEPSKQANHIRVSRQPRRWKDVDKVSLLFRP